MKFDSQDSIYVAGPAYDSGLFAAKYAADGSLVWSNHYAGLLLGSVSRAIDVDGAGNSYVTASCASDWVTIKQVPSGAPAWTNWVNGSGNGDDAPAAITTDSSGNVYVAGGTFLGNGSVPDYSITVVSYNPQGVQRWRTDNRSYPNWEFGQATSIMADNHGHLIVGAIQNHHRSELQPDQPHQRNGSFHEHDIVLVDGHPA